MAFFFWSMWLSRTAHQHLAKNPLSPGRTQPQPHCFESIFLAGYHPYWISAVASARIRAPPCMQTTRGVFFSTLPRRGVSAFGVSYRFGVKYGASRWRKTPKNRLKSPKGKYRQILPKRLPQKFTDFPGKLASLALRCLQYIQPRLIRAL